MRGLTSRKAIAVTFHGVAIACTALRLSYRYNVLRLGWEDMWAAVSMMSELVCFACALLERPPEADGEFYFADIIRFNVLNQRLNQYCRYNASG
jgi:hypothetical protein